MRRLNNCLENKKYTNIPIWFMRQAGRYLKEFRDIRKNNPDFINLCLNQKLVNEISLQPIKKFDLDAVILFSDILIIPYGLGQKVTFKKNIGPILGDLNLDLILNVKANDFINRINPAQESKSCIIFAPASICLSICKHIISSNFTIKLFNKFLSLKIFFLLKSFFGDCL